MANITAIIQRLWSGFFGFWVQKRRVTILLIILIIALGIQWLVQIPKESAPQINLGLINVTTVYPGASPEDVDELITSKMETELSEVDGIKSLASTSSAGVSSVMVTVDDWFDSQQVLTDIKAQVDRVSLPSEATDPSVIDITTDSNGLFSLILYAPKQATTIDYIKSKAKDIAYVMKSHPDVADIIIWQEDVYDIRVIVDQNKAESIGLTSQSIASIINGYVSNIPLGNYQIDTAKYDYRINKTISNKEELWSVMIPTSAGSIPLQSIATIVDFYDEEVLTYYGSYDDTGYHYVSLAFEKPTKVIDIQSASNRLQIDLEELLTWSEFTGISYALTNDAAESITESNLSVLNNGVTTLVLVFVVVLFFVSFKEALIATLSIPLAFFITFFVLQKLWYTLNFLTNFSLIVTFGIAIDTIIVILEWATEKTKLGYNPYEAALLALHEYKTPLIAGTATTCVVFLPLFVLPGVLGKYLANIPITIFITLIGALLVSLLINPAVFFLVTPKSKQYINNEEEEFLDADEKALLAYHREKKTKKTTTDSSRRHQFFDTMGERYKSCIHRMVHASKAQKMMIIFLPIVGLVLSFFLGVWFTMFPESEAEVMNVSITWPAGSHISYFDNYHDDIESVLSSYPELKQYTYNVSSNTINIAIDLTDINLRKKID